MGLWSGRAVFHIGRDPGTTVSRHPEGDTVISVIDGEAEVARE